MSRIEPVIYLDLDGVCADYVSAAIRAFGRDPAEVLEYWRHKLPGEYRMYNVLDVDRETYWKTISAQGEAFWSGLDAYPWFEALYRSLSEAAPVIFLTSASRAPECLSGKLKWLQARFGESFREYIITGHKQQLAGPGTILVDDFDRNIDRFCRAGGSGVLFPQIWNTNHALENRLEYVAGAIKDWHTNAT